MIFFFKSTRVKFKSGLLQCFLEEAIRALEKSISGSIDSFLIHATLKTLMGILAEDTMLFDVAPQSFQNCLKQNMSYFQVHFIGLVKIYPIAHLKLYAAPVPGYLSREVYTLFARWLNSPSNSMPKIEKCPKLEQDVILHFLFPKRY